ncbi:hypothetical protein OG311_13490 [Streptomyces sp. NBC_01343]|uniref:hypothetical protein n=1 Tax=Streptomyces sp. NBC_01343 TaxID=2903832 RepID=UPI002E10B6F7|nr:hypothetical protein OG311_13490 [Streptomyces sp. NBC_01343]
MELIEKLLTSNFGSALLGAIIGGVASLLGASRQAKSANKTARETLDQATARSAYETLGQLRELLAEQAFEGRGTTESRGKWNRESRVLLLRAAGAANLLPESEKQRRAQIHNALRLIPDWNGLEAWQVHQRRVEIPLREAREQLKSYILGSEAPPVRDIAQVVSDTLAEEQRQSMIALMIELEERGEREGLDEPEDIETYEELQAALGVQHSGELNLPSAQSATP